MTKNIYYESRGEPVKGMQAVALVTMNRVKTDGWPDTVCAVVKQKQRGVCQFSWVCKKNRVRDHDSYELANDIALSVMSGRVRDFTHGATHFHATRLGIKYKSRKKPTTIGNHVFYSFDRK